MRTVGEVATEIVHSIANDGDYLGYNAMDEEHVVLLRLKGTLFDLLMTFDADGDADIEQVSEDEGAQSEGEGEQCEDEGGQCDDEGFSYLVKK